MFSSKTLGFRCSAAAIMRMSYMVESENPATKTSQEMDITANRNIECCEQSANNSNMT